MKKPSNNLTGSLKPEVIYKIFSIEKFLYIKYLLLRYNHYLCHT